MKAPNNKLSLYSSTVASKGNTFLPSASPPHSIVLHKECVPFSGRAARVGLTPIFTHNNKQMDH
jgi:hypothetical protein